MKESGNKLGQRHQDKGALLHQRMRQAQVPAPDRGVLLKGCRRFFGRGCRLRANPPQFDFYLQELLQERIGVERSLQLQYLVIKKLLGLEAPGRRGIKPRSPADTAAPQGNLFAGRLECLHAIAQIAAQQQICCICFHKQSFPLGRYEANQPSSNFNLFFTENPNTYTSN